MSTTLSPSSSFIWRRVHSLMGFWLLIYLVEHLTVNSQAALWLGDRGIGFIRLVNLIQAIPYLQVVETLLIGIPLLVHGIWGIQRAYTARLNSFGSKTKAPHLTYGRNRAFTWQRLTSWVLLFGILGHVVQMRFLDKPKEAYRGEERGYFSKVSFDPGLTSLSVKLGVRLMDRAELEATPSQTAWDQTLHSFSLKSNEVILVCPNPGTALLLMVRDTFKNPLYCVLYTIFVLAAAYHAFNGFWTFLITWGALLTYRSQKAMIPASVMGMSLLAFLGLVAIWGSYWVNLRS